MNAELKCWKCAASLEEVLLPLARLSECPHCSADLHVCRMCVFYDTGVADACREPIAEPVANKERANFCGYLEPLTATSEETNQAHEATARKDLEALFGLTPETAEKPSATDELNDLFGLNEDNNDP